MCTAVLIGWGPPPPSPRIWRYWSAKIDDISLWLAEEQWGVVGGGGFIRSKRISRIVLDTDGQPCLTMLYKSRVYMKIISEWMRWITPRKRICSDTRKVNSLNSWFRFSISKGAAWHIGCGVLTNSSASAHCKAGPSSNLGSAPQRRPSSARKRWRQEEAVLDELYILIL